MLWRLLEATEAGFEYMLSRAVYLLGLSVGSSSVPRGFTGTWPWLAVASVCVGAWGDMGHLQNILKKTKSKKRRCRVCLVPCGRFG